MVLPRAIRPWFFTDRHVRPLCFHLLTGHPFRAARSMASRAAIIVLSALFSTQAYSGYMVSSPGSYLEPAAYSFEDTGDFLFFISSSMAIDAPSDTSAPLLLLQFSQAASPDQSAIALQPAAAAARGAIASANPGVTDANGGLTIEIERHSNKADAKSDKNRETKTAYDPTAYVDQYVYTAIGDYVQQSGVDIEPMHRSYNAVATSIEKFDPYIPQPLKHPSGTKPENVSIHISSFESTLPGRIFAWVIHPGNFTSIIFALLSGFAGFAAFNILLRILARKARRRTH
ncbi:MAG: hypothetical protein ACOY2B_01300 [Pseudomonadota bacterium]